MKRKIDIVYVVTSLTLMAWAAVGVNYIGTVITGQTRWAFLAVLIMVVIGSRKIHLSMRGAFGGMMFLYLFWCCATIAWSEVPQLSAMKAIAMVLVAVPCCSAGVWWAQRSEPETLLSVTWPLVAVVIGAGAFGVVQTEYSVVGTGALTLYRGLTGNSNYLGILIILAFPAVLWEVHTGRGRPTWRRLLGRALLLALVVMLVGTASRASLAGVGVIVTAYVLTARFRGRQAAAMLGVLALLAIVVVWPGLIDAAIHRLVLKGQETASDFALSRQSAWQESVIHARQGGMIGGGLGVTIGDTNFAGGLSASHYGREKGSSTLAILEELGIVGYILYLTLLASIFYPLYRATRAAAEPRIRVLLALILGTLLGLTVNAQLEAWWVAPGAAPALYFWTLTGMGLGLAARMRAHQRQQRAAAAGYDQPYPPGAYAMRRGDV